MISWSPSVVGNNFSLTAQARTEHSLFPPFIQKKSQKSDKSSEVPHRATHIDSAENTHPARETRTIPFEVETDDRTSACRNPSGDVSYTENRNLRDQIVEKCPISCDSKCKTNNLIHKGLRERLHDDTNSFVEITNDELYDVLELYDEDYQQWLEGSGREDADHGDRIEKTDWPWLLDPCKSFPSISEPEEDHQNTMEPYLSHKLSVPYTRVPRSRYFNAAGRNAEYVANLLPRRPRSPLRTLLPGKFNMRAALEEWNQKHQVSETKQYLQESKERICQSLNRLSVDQNDRDSLTSIVVLQTICEQVVLTVMDAKIDIDIHTFINIAVALALTEMEHFSIDMLSKHFALPKNLELFDSMHSSIGHNMRPGGMRRALLGVYRAPFNRNIYASLHRRLPWSYISPSHERGHMKLYPNVRERIDEKIPEMQDDSLTSSYLPDLMCPHHSDILDTSHVAYKRKSKSPTLPPTTPSKMFEELLVHLASFT